MKDEFPLVKDALTNGRIDVIGIEDAPTRRLLMALGHKGRHAHGSADIASLIRHVLRGEQIRQSGISPTLSIMKTIPDFGDEKWAEFGIDVIGKTATHLSLQARPWSPDWLVDSTFDSVDGPASAAIPSANPGPSV